MFVRSARSGPGQHEERGAKVHPGVRLDQTSKELCSIRTRLLDGLGSFVERGVVDDTRHPGTGAHRGRYAIVHAPRHDQPGEAMTAPACEICRNAIDNRVFSSRETMFGLRERSDHLECLV
jgi:hypothetical protein